MKDDENEEKEELELKRLREIAKISSIYNRNSKSFERNKSISHIVHAVMNFAQFSCVLINELFHHIHHAINRKLREKNPQVPELPEERNPIFFAYPICIIISLILCILWLRFHTFSRTIDASLVGCVVCIVLMLLASISSMRHAEIYINLEEVSDDQLLTHPIFIHNFIMCIISILSMTIYLIHFWVLYDCWRWRRKTRAQVSSPGSSSDDEPSTSRKNETALQDDLDSIATWETLKKNLFDTDRMDVEKEPVILYCCCVDIWKYLKERDDRKSMHEFQVVHVK